MSLTFPNALALPLFLALPFLVQAQTPSACTTNSTHQTTTTLTGAVTDPSGAAIVSATVTLTCGETMLTTHTTADGHFSIAASPGAYDLQITAANFQPDTRTVQLHGQRQTLDATLALGHASSIVSVTAAPGFVAGSSTTATKTDTPLIETPQSVSVITLDQLKQRNVQTLNQALAFSSGVGVQTYGSETRFDWFNIRGFDESTYGLFRDNSRWQSGQVEGQIDPYELQEVDVIKGPSSVLYGQNTPGGLVNLVTKRPESSESNELILNLGSFNRRQVQGDFGGPLDAAAHWRYRVLGLYRDSDSQVNFVPDGRRLIAPALTWAPSGNTTLTILTDYQYDNTGWSQFLPAEGTLFASPFGRIPTSFFTGEPGFDFFHRQQWSAAYLFEHRFAHAWTVRQTSRFSKISFNGDTAFGAGLQADGRTLNRDGYSDELGLGLYTLDTQALSQFKTGPVQHSFLAGVDYSHAVNTILNGLSLAPSLDVFAPRYGAAIPTPVLYSHTEQPSEQTGLYLQDHIVLAHHFIATLSGRQDWTGLTTRQLLGDTTTRQSPSAFTGRAGVSYLSDLGVAPYFSYSTSFLPTTGVNFFGTPFLPTKGTQYEAGAKYQPKASDSFLTASFFNITEQNVLTTDPANPLNSLQTGAIRSRGVEFEGVASILHGLDLHASYTHLDEVVTETTDLTQLGKRPTLIPDQMAGLTLHYTLSRTRLAGLGVGFGVRYVGTTAGDPQNTLLLPGYTLFDASALYDWRQLRFQVNATNLGDKIYVPLCTSLSYCNYGYRRNVIGSIQFRWESWKGLM